MESSLWTVAPSTFVNTGCPHQVTNYVSHSSAHHSLQYKVLQLTYFTFTLTLRVLTSCPGALISLLQTVATSNPASILIFVVRVRSPDLCSPSAKVVYEGGRDLGVVLVDRAFL